MGTKKNKTIFEKILSIFAWFVFFIALFTAILSIFATFSGEKNGKEMFGYKVLIVNTDSMSKSPTSSANNDESIFFNAGDIIIIKTTKDGTGYKVGDVISFISYSLKNSDRFTTKLKGSEIRFSETPSSLRCHLPWLIKEGMALKPERI